MLSNRNSHLKPGAWFELAELGNVIYSDDNSMPEDWPPKVTLELTCEGLHKLGRITPETQWLEKLLKDAGFVDVKVSQPALVSWRHWAASTAVTTDYGGYRSPYTLPF